MYVNLSTVMYVNLTIVFKANLCFGQLDHCGVDEVDCCVVD